MKKLIVGLGNPGPQYAWTRHNLGFLSVETLAKRCQASWRRSILAQGVTAQAVIEGAGCSLLMPLTFMNHSGEAVKAMVAKQGVLPEDVLVVCDDMSLPFGRLRLRPSGSSGGHNGLKSIIEHMGSDGFARLRLGIGRPRPGHDPVDYVLENFTSGEKKNLPDFINHALDCVTSWVAEGAQATMNKFNKGQTNEQV